MPVPAVMELSPESPILEMLGMTKRFAGVTVLRNVDFSVRSGEVHALMGENGAGKSTLMKILGGVHRPSAGKVRFLGKPFQATDPGQVLHAGIALIHQEISLVPHLTVAENLLLGAEPIRRGFLLDRPAMDRRARTLLSSLDDRIDPSARVEQLSIAEQQVVEIARALRHENRILVMDEPTASLDATNREVVLHLIEEAKARGAAILGIFHDEAARERVCDRLVDVTGFTPPGHRPGAAA